MPSLRSVGIFLKTDSFFEKGVDKRGKVWYNTLVIRRQQVSGKSRLLSRSTSGYHYHTVMADSEEILDAIQEELKKNNYLAPLQPEEPVHFGPPEE